MAENDDDDALIVSNNALGEVPGAVDLKLEEDGEWFEHAPEPDSEEVTRPNQIEGFRHLLMDANGNGLRRVLFRSRHTKAYRRKADMIQTRAIRMTKEKRATFVRREVALLDAQFCICDWDFTDVHGSKIPFSTQLAAVLMTNPRYRHHREFMEVGIATLQGDIERIAEEDRGN